MSKKNGPPPIVFILVALALIAGGYWWFFKRDTTPQIGSQISDDNPSLVNQPIAEAFPAPQSVPNGTTLRIDGSTSMVTINQNLQRGFEQPDYLEKPNAWAAFVENLTQKLFETKTKDDGILQRKVRAHSNFTEYVPLALLLIIALELINAASVLIWLLGSCLTIARIAHAWGLIKTYGPSPGRAFGFFLTWFVYLIGAGACIFYGMKGLI